VYISCRDNTFEAKAKTKGSAFGASEVSRVRIRASVRGRVWLLFDYSNHATATYSLRIHLSYKDNKLPTTSWPLQFEAKAKAKARNVCPLCFLEVEDGP